MSHLGITILLKENLKKHEVKRLEKKAFGMFIGFSKDLLLQGEFLEFIL